jgi:hypothetical protein
MLAHKAMRAGVLLANNEQGLGQDSSAMRQVSKICLGNEEPPEKLSPITSPWPFAKWGVDIVWPMPPGKENRKFLLVAIDYFTKWAEAEAFSTITIGIVIKFLWSSVICRFGIPHAFVTDNGKQFDCRPFRKWCAELQIRNYYSTPIHPPANGQVEATNKTLLKTLKKKLSRKKEHTGELLINTSPTGICLNIPNIQDVQPNAIGQRFW